MVELALLLSLTRHDFAVSLRPTFAIVAFAQFVTIPALGAIVSLFRYGLQRWRLRVSVYLVSGFAAFFLALALAFGIAGLATIYEEHRLLFCLFACLYVGLISFAGRFIAKRTSRWGAQLEKVRWLAERSWTPEQRRGRDEAIRVAVSLPSVLVLLVFLFLPEVWGFTSHFYFPQPARISEYEVDVPSTWVVLIDLEEPPAAYSQLGGVAGIGFGLSPRRYWKRDMPLSEWGFYAYAPNESSAGAPDIFGREIARRRVGSGLTQVLCVEYWPKYLEPGGEDSVAFVHCRGPGTT